MILSEENFIPEGAAEADAMQNAASNSNLNDMVPKSRVEEIVKAQKAQAAQSARRQMEEEWKEREARIRQEASQSMGGMASVNVDDLKRDIYEKIMQEAREAQEQQEQARYREAMQEVANTYREKLKKGPESYEDFQTVMSKFNAAAFPKLVYLASKLDNTADIMYELAKNPMKLASIDYLADKNADAAEEALRSLGESIANNRSAQQQAMRMNEPLSRLKSSVNAGADSGELGLSDLKKASWLRG